MSPKLDLQYLTKTPEYQALKEHYDTEAQGFCMKKWFENEKDRYDQFHIDLKVDSDEASKVDFVVDYSKNLVTCKTMGLLMNLLKARKVDMYKNAMFSGMKINTTEDRAVLHVALRNMSMTPIYVDGVDVMANVSSVLNKLKHFVDSVHEGKHLGCTGKKIDTIVNIGIGGSDLGPVMATLALKDYSIPGMKVHFVSNIDPADIYNTVDNCNPETTLFVISSKTFTTIETMTNATAAKDWVVKSLGSKADVKKHFIAVSTNAAKVTEFGIDGNNMFEFWDWVGGRYSLWSSIGISIALYVGFNNYKNLLEGAHIIDKHFQTAPLEKNAPAILAALGIWYNNFYGHQTHAILPYDAYLSRFAAYFQQGDMESNGKSVTKDNIFINDYSTGPIIWGEPGTNGQHAFYQLIHQGTKVVPADFILQLSPRGKHAFAKKHYKILTANCIAQTRALAVGKSETEVAQELEKAGIGTNHPNYQVLLHHKQFSGNRPSNTIAYKKLTPKTLGALISLYEHKIFVQGVVWNINSFDQWGVELGKSLALSVLDVIEKSSQPTFDSSTNALIKLCSF